MEQKLSKIFQKAKYETNPNLPEKVWTAVSLYNRRIARIKLFSFSLLGLISVVGFVPALITLKSDLSRSGFYEYSSLAFSNNGMIVTYWKEFSLSILESLPMISILFVMILLFTFFLSLKHAIKQAEQSNLSLSF